MKEDYVKSIGQVFIYSQKAIDLVSEYLQRFPRLFIILSRHDSSLPLCVDQFDDGSTSGVDYIKNVTDWLAGLPCSHSQLTNTNTMNLSVEAYDDVKRAVQESVRIPISNVFSTRSQRIRLFFP